MRYGAAMRFGDGHQQRMQLVEERGIRRQVGFEQRACILVPTAAGQEPVTCEHAARVGVGHEDGPAGRIEKDGIGRLGPEAGHGKHLASQGAERRATHGAEIAAEASEQPAGELDQPARLEPKSPGGADERFERRHRRGRQPFGNEQATGPQSGHRLGGAAPGRVLREDRAHGDLERCPGRPPALRPVMGQQRPVEPEQACLDRIAWRAGNSTPRAQHRAG